MLFTSLLVNKWSSPSFNYVHWNPAPVFRTQWRVWVYIDKSLLTCKKLLANSIIIKKPVVKHIWMQQIIIQRMISQCLTGSSHINIRSDMSWTSMSGWKLKQVSVMCTYTKITHNKSCVNQYAFWMPYPFF